MFYVVTEEYPLECIFDYNLVFPNVSLFSRRACYIFCVNMSVSLL